MVGAGAWTELNRRAGSDFLSPVRETAAQRVGGRRSDGVSRLAPRVLPSGVSVVDDPGSKEFQW